MTDINNTNFYIERLDQVFPDWQYTDLKQTIVVEEFAFAPIDQDRFEIYYRDEFIGVREADGTVLFGKAVCSDEGEVVGVEDEANEQSVYIEDPQPSSLSENSTGHTPTLLPNLSLFKNFDWSSSDNTTSGNPAVARVARPPQRNIPQIETFYSNRSVVLNPNGIEPVNPSLNSARLFLSEDTVRLEPYTQPFAPVVASSVTSAVVFTSTEAESTGSTNIRLVGSSETEPHNDVEGSVVVSASARPELQTGSSIEEISIGQITPVVVQTSVGSDIPCVVSAAQMLDRTADHDLRIRPENNFSRSGEVLISVHQNAQPQIQAQSVVDNDTSAGNARTNHNPFAVMSGSNQGIGSQNSSQLAFLGAPAFYADQDARRSGLSLSAFANSSNNMERLALRPVNGQSDYTDQNGNQDQGSHGNDQGEEENQSNEELSA